MFRKVCKYFEKYLKSFERFCNNFENRWDFLKKRKRILENRKLQNYMWICSYVLVLCDCDAVGYTVLCFHCSVLDVVGTIYKQDSAEIFEN